MRSRSYDSFFNPAPGPGGSDLDRGYLAGCELRADRLFRGGCGRARRFRRAHPRFGALPGGRGPGMPGGDPGFTIADLARQPPQARRGRSVGRRSTRQPGGFVRRSSVSRAVPRGCGKGAEDARQQPAVRIRAARSDSCGNGRRRSGSRSGP